MADRKAPSQSQAASTLLPSKVDPTSARFEANMRFMADLVSQVRNEEEKIREIAADGSGTDQFAG